MEDEAEVPDLFIYEVSRVIIGQFCSSIVTMVRKCCQGSRLPLREIHHDQNEILLAVTWGEIRAQQ